MAKAVPEIMAFIPVGHENAVSRHDLAVLMEMNDREMRNSIMDARIDGYLILNRQDGQGYFTVKPEEDGTYSDESLDEIAAQYMQNRRRALAILAQQKKMEKILKSAGRMVGRKVLTTADLKKYDDGQMTLKDL